MCTAAHVLQQVESAQDSGVELSDWHINDTSVRGRGHRAYPIQSYDRRRAWQHRDDQLGIDIGLWVLDQLAAKNSERMGKAAISSSDVAWPLGPNVECWVIVGYPGSHLRVLGNYVEQALYKLRVTPLEGCPDSWRPKYEESLGCFGHIDSFDDPDWKNLNIEGMSGGPVFGVFRKSPEYAELKLVGVQSGWMKTTGNVLVCPMGEILKIFENLINQSSEAPS